MLEGRTEKLFDSSKRENERQDFDELIAPCSYIIQAKKTHLKENW